MEPDDGRGLGRSVGVVVAALAIAVVVLAMVWSSGHGPGAPLMANGPRIAQTQGAASAS